MSRFTLPMLDLQDALQSAEKAYNANNLSATLRYCEQVLAEQPEQLDALVLKGLATLKSGDAAAGIEDLKAAINHHPKTLEPRLALANAYLQLGQPQLAIEHSSCAVDFAPEDPDVLFLYGLNLVDLSQFPEAVTIFQKVVQLQPRHIPAHQNLAMALRDCGREFDAIREWETFLKRFPNQLQGYIQLGQLRLAHGDFPRAIGAADNALKLESFNPTAHLLKALALAENRQSQEAEKHLRKAIKLNPKDGVARASLGFWLQEQGDFQDAAEHLSQAIEINPTHGFAYYNYFRAKKATEDDRAFLAKMQKIADSSRLHPRDKGYLRYALGKAHEDLKEYDEAFKHYKDANDLAYEVWLARKPWDKTEYDANFSQTISTFNSENLDRLTQTGNPSTKPIFIVGMIRSGTSLLEQIISSHPLVTGAGELPFWHENEERAFNESGQPDPQKIAELATEYLDEIDSLSEGGQHVTDKLPHNYALLGHIHAAFPNAKMIHVGRNPVDNCLSIYTTAYQRPPVFAHKPENIVFEYNQYLRIMEHWRVTLPQDTLLELTYEDIVADREAATRKILEFCGLDWDPNCLAHESNKRSVRTPSLWQVRQPIYTTSVERWKRFEPWIPQFLTLQNNQPS